MGTVNPSAGSVNNLPRLYRFLSVHRFLGDWRAFRVWQLHYSPWSVKPWIHSSGGICRRPKRVDLQNLPDYLLTSMSVKRPLYGSIGRHVFVYSLAVSGLERNLQLHQLRAAWSTEKLVDMSDGFGLWALLCMGNWGSGLPRFYSAHHHERSPRLCHTEPPRCPQCLLSRVIKVAPSHRITFPCLEFPS